jgi:hypothetical protein
MKTRLVIIAFFLSGLMGTHAFSQSEKDTTLSGLPGDNLDLAAVLDLFQKSKTIEDFEKTLNLEKTKINNLDLNLDGKVDFIKVITKKDGDNFSFILQVDINEKEKQDVAVILLSKDKNQKVTLQIVGDKDLYGKDYVIEPKTKPTPSVTPNPAYTGSDPVKEAVPASTTVVVVESAPVVQYVYSPAYVPYAPPYYYGYYPPYFVPFHVMAVSAYAFGCAAFHAAYHGGAYGYHGNTVVINNHNTYNNYNSTRNTSNTVNNNRTSGKYNSGGQGGQGGARPSTGDVNRGGRGNQSGQGSARPSTGDVNRGGQGGTRPSTGDVNRGGQGGTRPSTGDVNRGGGNRSSASPSTRQSSSGSFGNSGRGGGGGTRGGSGFSGGGHGGGGRGGGGRR